MIIVMLFLHTICRANDFGFIYKALIQTYVRLVFFQQTSLVFLVSRIVPHKVVFTSFIRKITQVENQLCLLKGVRTTLVFSY